MGVSEGRKINSSDSTILYSALSRATNPIATTVRLPWENGRGLCKTRERPSPVHAIMNT